LKPDSGVEVRVSGQAAGRSQLRHLADEMTATLAALIGYVAVLAVLGVGVIQLLHMEEVGAEIETVPRTVLVTAERPVVLPEETPREGRLQLRQSVAVR
jgi:hypothetical protein